MTNRSVKNGEPIPDINTNINTDNNLTISKDTVCRTDVQRAAKQKELPSTYSLACLL